MKKVLTAILLVLLISCGDTFSNDSSKKDLKKIQVSKDGTEGNGGSGGGAGGQPDPPTGG